MSQFCKNDWNIRRNEAVKIQVEINKRKYTSGFFAAPKKVKKIHKLAKLPKSRQKIRNIDFESPDQKPWISKPKWVTSDFATLLNKILMLNKTYLLRKRINSKYATTQRKWACCIKQETFFHSSLFYDSKLPMAISWYTLSRFFFLDLIAQAHLGKLYTSPNRSFS